MSTVIISIIQVLMGEIRTAELIIQSNIIVSFITNSVNMKESSLKNATAAMDIIRNIIKEIPSSAPEFLSGGLLLHLDHFLNFKHSRFLLGTIPLIR